MLVVAEVQVEPDVLLVLVSEILAWTHTEFCPLITGLLLTVRLLVAMQPLAAVNVITVLPAPTAFN